MRHLLLAAIAALGLATAGPVAADDGFQPSVDLPGYDYRGITLSRPRLCQAACENDDRCRAWTFVRVGVLGPLSSCWLKSGVSGPPRQDSCCVSGRR